MLNPFEVPAYRSPIFFRELLQPLPDRFSARSGAEEDKGNLLSHEPLVSHL